MKPGESAHRRWVRSALVLSVWLAIASIPVRAVQSQSSSTRSSVESALDRVLSDPNLKGTDVGVLIRSLNEPETIYERRALETFTTASNTKLVTTATALDLLGEDFYFETRFGLRGVAREGGRFAGDLVVEGEGDPGLGARFHGGDPVGAFRQVAAALQERGIRVIAGHLVLDDRAFDHEYVEPGWPSDQLDRSYAAPVSALALSENCVDVLVEPASTAGASAAAWIVPRTDVLLINNDCRTLARLQKNQGPKVYRSGESIRVGGEVRTGDGPSRIVLSVPDPLGFFGDVLVRTLADAGIRVEGELRRATAGELLTTEERIYTHRTPLDTVVAVINKESQNFFAEQLYKRLAAHGFPGQPASFALAGAVVKRHLESLGIPADQVQSADGSGLSRNNAFAPAHLVRLLEAMYRGPHRNVFVASLPISGVDGTLEDRLGGAYRGRVRAKTGYISRVSALSGYVRTRSDRTLGFSILMNGFRSSNGEMKRIQDEICRVLIDQL